MQMQKYINVVARGMSLDKRKVPWKDTLSLAKALSGWVIEDDASSLLHSPITSDHTSQAFTSKVSNFSI